MAALYDAELSTDPGGDDTLSFAPGGEAAGSEPAAEAAGSKATGEAKRARGSKGPRAGKASKRSKAAVEAKPAEPTVAAASPAAEEGEAALVRFDGPKPWTGRFAPGHGGVTTVVRLWESEAFLVVSRGQAYVVDAATRELQRSFGGWVEWILVVPHLDLLVFHNRLWVEGLFSSGLAWQTRRLSWDGLRNLTLDGDALVGEAYDPGPKQWVRVSVDLSTGDAVGGSYVRAG